MRFGLTGGRPRTLEEVGRAFNVTRERIRQIENHTLKKLESLPEAQRLRDAELAPRRARAPARRWRGQDSNLRRQSQCGLQPHPV